MLLLKIFVLFFLNRTFAWAMGVLLERVEVAVFFCCSSALSSFIWGWKLNSILAFKIDPDCGSSKTGAIPTVMVEVALTENSSGSKYWSNVYVIIKDKICKPSESNGQRPNCLKNFNERSCAMAVASITQSTQMTSMPTPNGVIHSNCIKQA